MKQEAHLKDFQRRHVFFEKSGIYTRDGRYAQVSGVELGFSEKGISLLDAPILHNEKALSSNFEKNLITTAEYLYKLMVIASSRNVVTNLVEGDPDAGNLMPPGSLHPIRIDLEALWELVLISSACVQIRLSWARKSFA